MARWRYMDRQMDELPAWLPSPSFFLAGIAEISFVVGAQAERAVAPDRRRRPG